MIALLGIGQEQILCGLFDRVLLPQAVRDEIEAGQAKDANVARLAMINGVETMMPIPIPDVVQGWGLGLGESSVLALASGEGDGCPAVLDDLAARRCARFLGIPVLGTG